jgi:hypothetical protein
VRPEGLFQRKTPMTPSEIEPATFWLVAQCLNELRQLVPHAFMWPNDKQYDTALKENTKAINLTVTSVKLPLDRSLPSSNRQKKSSHLLNLNLSLRNLLKIS